MDLANLRLAIDTGDLTRARRELELLEDEARRAEGATTKLSKSTDILARVYRDVATAAATWKVLDTIQDVTMANARYQELGIVMGVVGKNAGYTVSQMQLYATQTQRMGISMTESRNTVIQLAQAQINLADASKLARVAQDAAVIGNTNSSDALQRMIHGIKTAQVDVLRTVGINVNFEKSYADLAKTLGVTTSSLSDQQKMQARENAVLSEGEKLTGTYEAAMTSAGKQIRSMTRYMDDLKVMTGEVFNEALTVAVMAVTEQLKGANKEVTALATNGQLKAWGNDVVDTFAFVADAGISLVSVIKMAGATMGWFAAMNTLSKKDYLLDPEGYKAQGKAINDAYDEDLNRLRNNTSMMRDALAARRKALGDDLVNSQINAQAQSRMQRQGTFTPPVVPQSTVVSGGGQGGVSEASKGLSVYNDLVNKASGYDSKWAEQVNQLGAARAKHLVTMDQYNLSINRLLHQQPFMVQQEKEAMDIAQQRQSARKKESDEIEAYMKKQVMDTLSADHAYVEATKSADAYISTLNKQYARELDGVGKGNSTRTFNSGLNTIEDKRTTSIQGYEKEVRDGSMSTDIFNKYKAVAESTYAAEVDAYTKRSEDLKSAQGNWLNGANEAMSNYLDNTQDVAKSTEAMFSNAFQGAEDALVNFVKTGELNFSSLADSAISDLIRIQVQQKVMPGLSAAMNSGGNWLAGLLGFADGGAFGAGGVQAFANGEAFHNSVLTSTTPFMFASGGSFAPAVAGESGAEAVMPLTRGTNGKLGVQASGSGGNSVVVNVIESPGNGGQQSRTTENGVDVITIMVDKIKSAIASDISRGTGSVPSAMAQTYGLNRVAGVY